MISEVTSGSHASMIQDVDFYVVDPSSSPLAYFDQGQVQGTVCNQRIKKLIESHRVLELDFFVVPAFG